MKYEVVLISSNTKQFRAFVVIHSFFFIIYKSNNQHASRMMLFDVGF
jgi:hypothetical protein